MFVSRLESGRETFAPFRPYISLLSASEKQDFEEVGPGMFRMTKSIAGNTN
jgi:hypothetical protein